MVLIVAHHYAVHSGFSFGSELSLNRWFVQIFSVGGKIGVNIFVLISAYFLCMQKNFRWQGLLKLVLQLICFSMGIYILCSFGKTTDFSVWGLIQSFRHSLCTWWFANVYIVFILIVPLLNPILAKAGQKEHLNLILLLTVLWSILPTIPVHLIAVPSGMNMLSWFFYLYLIAAYMRKYPNPYTDSVKLSAAVFVLVSAVIVLWFFVLDFAGAYIHPRFSGTSNSIAYQAEHLLILGSSVSLFALMKNIQIPPSRFINTAAAAVFGVYLLHDHPETRPYIWKSLLKTADWQDSALLVFHGLFCIVLVFAVCTVLSWLYNIVIDVRIKDFISRSEPAVLNIVRRGTALAASGILYLKQKAEKFL